MNLNAIDNQNQQKYVQNPHDKNENKPDNKTEKQEPSLEETMNQSAVEVSISMNAQFVLFELKSIDITNTNLLTQSTLTQDKEDVLNFLSGKEAENGLTLKDIGYEGKPIIELSNEEAKELISEDGFFGVTQTSDRVANFVFSFANNDLELLQKGRDGIVQGFEEAEKLFGGELPDISYETQERTLRLIDERINSLTNKE